MMRGMGRCMTVLATANEWKYHRDPMQVAGMVLVGSAVFERWPIYVFVCAYSSMCPLDLGL